MNGDQIFALQKSFKRSQPPSFLFSVTVIRTMHVQQVDSFQMLASRCFTNPRIRESTHPEDATPNHGYQRTHKPVASASLVGNNPSVLRDFDAYSSYQRHLVQKFTHALLRVHVELFDSHKI
jgi:hypothetical protein